jgi:protein-tyrosine phosphatase
MGVWCDEILTSYRFWELVAVGIVPKRKRARVVECRYGYGRSGWVIGAFRCE